MGGTMLLQPLQMVMATTPSEAAPRQVFVMTDGDVSNDQAVIQFCKHHCTNTRIFSFGIGADCGKRLVSQIAVVTHGQSVFVSENKDIPQAVMQQLSRAVQPSFESVMLECNIAGLRQSPMALPPIFNQETYTIFGLAPALTIPFSEITARLKCVTPKKLEKVFVLKPSGNSAVLGQSIHQLAAASVV
jgi:hypothetical protein